MVLVATSLPVERFALSIVPMHEQLEHRRHMLSGYLLRCDIALWQFIFDGLVLAIQRPLVPPRRAGTFMPQREAVNGKARS